MVGCDWQELVTWSAVIECEWFPSAAFDWLDVVMWLADGHGVSRSLDEVEAENEHYLLWDRLKYMSLEKFKSSVVNCTIEKILKFCRCIAPCPTASVKSASEIFKIFLQGCYKGSKTSCAQGYKDLPWVTRFASSGSGSSQRLFAGFTHFSIFKLSIQTSLKLAIAAHKFWRSKT